MKAGLGASLAAAAAVRRAGIALKGNLILMPVVGEHQGGVGTDYNIRNVTVPDMTIVNESTNLGILTKSPSSISVLVSAIGETRHISRLFLPPEPVNAINKMCKVIDAVQKMKFTYVPSQDFPELPVVNIGAIMGGKGREYNIHRDTTTASYCTVSINIRGPHSMTAESVKKDLQRELETLKTKDPTLQYEIEIPPETYREPWRVKKLFMPGNNLPLNSYIVQALQKNHRFVTGSEPRVGTKKYSTDDAGRLTLAGSQALSYGPGTRSETRPTREGVVVDTIVTCAKVLAATAIEVCSTNKEATAKK
jgi:acetylornithine deacetylase/succinyl-diaminopimelate desuccinylase-like protein